MFTRCRYLYDALIYNLSAFINYRVLCKFRFIVTTAAAGTNCNGHWQLNSVVEPEPQEP
jgi:hypothetical protein